MGVYLSTPNTEKISTDESCENLSYGASSMQGWRMSQEDAHNCLPVFGSKGTSFFAVYDGHGGAEVAQYCALKFPDYVKQTKEYKDGELSDALVEAFLGFDNLLLKDEVLKELKVMAGLDEEEEDSPRKSKHEADMLRAEADMPIEDLLAQYEGNVPVPQEIKNLRKKKTINSPSLRAKRPKFPNERGDDDESDEEPETEKETSKASVSTNVSATITSQTMSDKLANGHAENENNLNREKEQNEILQKQSQQLQDNYKDVSSVTCDSAMKTEDTSAMKGETTSSQMDSSEACSSSVTASSSSQPSSSSSSCSSNLVQNSSVSSSDNVTKDKKISLDTNSPEVDSTSGDVDIGHSSKVNPAGSSVSDSCVQSSSSNVCESSSGGSGSNSCGGSVKSEEQMSGSCEAQSSSSGSQSSSKMKSMSDSDSEEEEERNILGGDDSDDEDDDDVEFDSEDEEDESEESEEDDEDLEVPFANGSDPANDEPGFCSGCTAVVALIHGKDIIVANAGDSRCVLCRDGKAVDMSFDHKPEDEPERKRINAAGGKVTNDGRVNGGLNLSRAIGDHFYKRNESMSDREQMITALPDLEFTTLQEKDEFLILACDGIWNYMTSQEAVDFVRERLKDPEKKKKLSTICEEIFDYCLAPNTMGDGTGCDNMTCIILTFDQMWNNNDNKRSCSQMDDDNDTGDVKQAEKKAKVESEAC